MAAACDAGLCTRRECNAKLFRRWVSLNSGVLLFFFFQAEDGIRDYKVTGVQTCALPISSPLRRAEIVLGYMLGFTVLALVQSAEVLAFSLLVLHVHNVGNVALIFLLEA